MAKVIVVRLVLTSVDATLWLDRSNGDGSGKAVVLQGPILRRSDYFNERLVKMENYGRRVAELLEVAYCQGRSQRTEGAEAKGDPGN